jgi:hypothetical protein
MAYIGTKPADKPLTSADITDSIITSAKIVDGTIVNGDINASAGVVFTKLASTGTLTVDNIQFPATAVASANANNLDDYEEGTWSPTLTASTSSSGQTYSDQTGRYTKIGRYVFCSIDLRLTAKGTLTGDVLIGNLPFTCINVGGSGGSVVYWAALGTNWSNVNVFIIPNTTTGYLTGAKTAGVDNAFFATADITNTTSFRINISYII